MNGNDKFFPFVFLPIKNIHPSNGILDWGLEAYPLMLEYLSLLALLHPNAPLDIHHETFKNYSSWSFEPIHTQKPWLPRIGPAFNIDKIEFKSNSTLSERENLLLSYFREGISVRNIFYSFLSFFKIFEFLFLKRTGRINDWGDIYDWIDNNLDEVRKLYFRKFARGLGDWDTFISLYNK